jgi:hypothetical protein
VARQPFIMTDPSTRRLNISRSQSSVLCFHRSVLPIQAQAFDLSKRNRREHYHACLGVHRDVDGRQRMSRRLWWKQLLPSRTAVQYVWRTIGSSCCFCNRHDEMMHEIHADCCSLVQYWHCERAGNHSVFVPCRQLLITVASSVLFHRTVWANSSSFRLRKRNRCKHCHAYFRCALGGLFAVLINKMCSFWERADDMMHADCCSLAPGAVVSLRTRS